MTWRAHFVDSQKMAPGKPGLYADVKVTYLPNDEASNTAIRDALDDLADSMKTGDPDQDVAVILISSHGELIDGQFYLVPYGVDIGSKNKIIASALSASDFAKKVQDIAKHGKVLLLLDSCHSGAVGPGGWATDPDAKVLRDAMNMENVTVLDLFGQEGAVGRTPQLAAWRPCAGVSRLAHRRGGRRWHRSADGAHRRHGQRTSVPDASSTKPWHACELWR